MVRGQQFGFRHDVWSLGVLSFFLIAGVFPFQAENDIDLKDKIINKEPDWSLLKKRLVGKDVIKLVQRMLTKNSLHRITAKRMIKLEVFEKVKINDSRVDYIASNGF